MAKYSSKINKIRTFALSLVLLVFDHVYRCVLQGIGLAVDLLYATRRVIDWIEYSRLLLDRYAFYEGSPGRMSGCEKETKVLGRVDMCMHCREPLTLDPALEGKEFDESYNRKKS